MKKYISILFVLISFVGCETVLNTPEKPDNKEREVNYKIKLVDDTGTLLEETGSDIVKGASVLMVSNSLKTKYELVSDENGYITLSNGISDTYLISVKMEVPLKNQGKSKFLVNTKETSIDLRADNKEKLFLSLDAIQEKTDLVFSELYVTGAKGSGMYFHDKYVEIFNQSDQIVYLDSLIISVVYGNYSQGINWVDDNDYVHSKIIWSFPGTGKDYPIQPGEYKVIAADALDHRVGAPESIDLSNADFEFYKSDSPDLDSKDVPNMIMFFQSSGFDWSIGARTGAVVLSNASLDSLVFSDNHYKIPMKSIIDGVEYNRDPSKLNEKILNPMIDGGLTGGLQFYSGKTLERILVEENGRFVLKDENNSTLDFKVYEKPSPGTHNELK